MFLNACQHTLIDLCRIVLAEEEKETEALASVYAVPAHTTYIISFNPPQQSYEYYITIPNL